MISSSLRKIDAPVPAPRTDPRPSAQLPDLSALAGLTTAEAHAEPLRLCTISLISWMKGPPPPPSSSRRRSVMSGSAEQVGVSAFLAGFDRSSADDRCELSQQEHGVRKQRIHRPTLSRPMTRLWSIHLCVREREREREGEREGESEREKARARERERGGGI